MLEGSTFEVLIISTYDFRIVHINKMGIEKLDYSPEELGNLTLFDITKEFDREYFRKFVEPLNKGSVDKLEYCTYHIRKDGTSYPVEVHLQSSTYNKEPVYVMVGLDISKRKFAEDRLRETTSQLIKMNKYETVIGIVTRTVYRSIDLQSVMDNAVNALNQNMDVAKNVCIYLVEGCEAVMYAHRGYPDWFIERVKVLQFPVGFTWRTIIKGKTIYVPDTKDDKVMGPAGRQLGTRSYVAIPLKNDGKVVGVITINSTEKDAFRMDELRVLDIVSRQIENAINKARFTESLIQSEKALEEKIQILSKKERYEKIINTVAASVHSSVDFDKVLELTAKNLRRNIRNADLFAIYFTEGGEAVLKASYGHPEWFNQKVSRIPYPRGLTWRTIIEGKTVYMPDTADDDSIGPSGKKLGIKSYISMPLTSEGKTTGCLTIAAMKTNAFSKEEIYLLESLTKQLETALLNAKYVEEIKTNERRLKALVGSVDETVFEMDDNGTYLGIWTDNEDLLIKPKNELLGSSVHAHYDKQIADKIVSTIRRVIRDRRPEIIEYKHELSRGERLFRARINPITASDERTSTVSMSSRDVTESKVLETTLLRVQRLESVGKLAGGIAHDLNNILHPITMSIQLLKTKIADEKSRKWLEMVDESAQRGSDLIRQILSFAKGLDSIKQPFDAKYLIKDVEKIIRETFPKTINVRIDIKEGLPCVFADYTQMHQVLLNLCVNARDAMHDGGELRISTGIVKRSEADSIRFLENNDYVTLEVKDTGTGMSAEVIDHIFDPFFSTKELNEGTGLGLSTVYGIIKEHDGFINVESEIGKGSAFTVYLPVRRNRAIKDISEDIFTETPFGNGEVILVVDDESMITDMMKSILEEFDYKVLVAHDGREALNTFLKHKDKVSAAIVDMMMPVMDGKSTVIELKKERPALKVVCISGYQKGNELLDMQDLEIDAFLPKPFNAERLLQTLKEIRH